MQNLNTVILIGNLVREPEVKYTTTGMAVATFVIANNNSYTKGNEVVQTVSYFEIKCFNNIAVTIEKYLHKGMQVAVRGQLKQDRWEDKTTGKNVSKIYVLADSIEFLTKKADSQNQQQPQQMAQQHTLNPWEDAPAQQQSYNQGNQLNPFSEMRQQRDANEQVNQCKDLFGAEEVYPQQYVDDDIPF